MAKKQKIDKLAQEAEMAMAAGMSYGRWKAMQEPVEQENHTEIEPELVVCKCCGKQFRPKVKRRQIYCDFFCQREAQYQRERHLRESEAESK